MVQRFALFQFSVDEAHRFYSCLDNRLQVGQAEYVLVEHIFDALFLDVQLRQELVAAGKRSFESHAEACYNRVDALPVQFGKADSGGGQKLMACVFDVMLVVGVVHNALQVAFVVADFHFQFEDVFSHCSFVLWQR